MTDTYEIEDLPAQPYVGIRGAVTMETIPQIADRIPELFGWLGERGIEPAGPPFLRYHVIDMERRLDIEAGVPVAKAPDGDGDVHQGELPAGRYVTTVHTGPFDQLVPAVAALFEWSDKQGLEFDRGDDPEGDSWAGRVEYYLSNPAEEPDPSKWQTKLAFKLR